MEKKTLQNVYHTVHLTRSEVNITTDIIMDEHQ